MHQRTNHRGLRDQVARRSQSELLAIQLEHQLAVTDLDIELSKSVGDLLVG